MHILVISTHIPMPDRTSGDLRFFSILKILSKTHSITFAVTAPDYQRQRIGEAAYQDYKNRLQDLSIAIHSKCVETIRTAKFEVIWFEYYFNTDWLIDIVRFYQPHAYVIVDSVDVHFKRFEAKARLTGLKADFEQAAKVKKAELTAYRQADLVIAVSDSDKQALHATCPNTEVAVITNIHRVPEFVRKFPGTAIKLLFVGGFTHSPNIDAVCFFCTEVMPLLRPRFTNLHLTIVGDSPPKEVLDLADRDITVTGYVPSVDPFYNEADIVIVPLRYGGGIKGKVGEAFSFSTPVVTTDFGAEGFQATPKTYYLLANTPAEFVDAISQLAHDKTLYHLIAKNAWEFIKEHYSEGAAETAIDTIFNNLPKIKRKKIRLDKWLHLTCDRFLDRNVLWRFRQ